MDKEELIVGMGFSLDTEMEKVAETEKDSVSATEECTRDDSISDVENKQIRLNSAPTARDIISSMFGEIEPVIKTDSAVSVEQDYGNEMEINVGMGKHGFMVIPDPHIWDKNIAGRKNYVEECWETFDSIYAIIKKNEFVTDVIIAGDLFHREFAKLDHVKPWMNYFQKLKVLVNSRGGQLYSVIGNHEYTYYKDNPFWLMQGLLIKTPHTIMCNGVKFYLDSYPSQKADREFVNRVTADICITHTEVIDASVHAEIESNWKKPMYISKRPVGYDRFDVKYLFCGHLHMALGQYVYVDDEDLDGKQTRIQYLGSLGRTNVMEISNKFLERLLPVVCVDEKGEISIKQLSVYLREYESTVIPVEVEAARKQREARKEYLASKQIELVDNPFEKLKEKYGNIPMAQEILVNLSENERPRLLVDVLSECQAIY